MQLDELSRHNSGLATTLDVIAEGQACPVRNSGCAIAPLSSKL